MLVELLFRLITDRTITRAETILVLESPQKPTFLYEIPLNNLFLIFAGFKVTDWRKGSDLFSDMPLSSLGEDTDDKGYETPMPDRSNPLSQPVSISGGGNNSSHGINGKYQWQNTDFGVDNKNRKRRSPGDPWKNLDRNTQSRMHIKPRISRSTERFGPARDAVEEAERQAFYPGKIHHKTGQSSGQMSKRFLKC